MKKLMAIILALVMVTGLMVGMQASAVKNLLPATEESAPIGDTVYIPDMFEKNVLIGAWTNLAIADVTTKIVTLDKSVKKLGNASIKIFNAKVGCSCFNMPLTNLKKNTTYTLQAWVKTDKVLSVDWGASFQIDFYNFPAVVDGPQSNYILASATVGSERFSGTKDWKRLTMVFKTPNATFNTAGVAFQLWGAAGTAWFDGVALTEGKVAVDDSNIENPTASTPTPKPTATPTPAPDVPSTWAKAEVNAAIAAKLVPAALQSKYTTAITRSDFCDLVVNMIEVKSGKTIAVFVKEKTGKDLTDKPFPDTTSVNVNAANKLGIVNGRTNGNFDPTGKITRQEAAKMLALAAKALGADITAPAKTFADGAMIADWAKEFVNYVFAKGVMNGTSATNFSPAANYTREQSMLTIYRLFKALA